MTTPTVTSNMAGHTNPGRKASVDFSETCRGVPADPRRSGSSQREHKLPKPQQPWLAPFGKNQAGLLEVPHTRTRRGTGTSCPRLGSTRHAPGLPSAWRPGLGPVSLEKSPVEKVQDQHKKHHTPTQRQDRRGTDL